jgi:hypothetical protein
MADALAAENPKAAAPRTGLCDSGRRLGGTCLRVHSPDLRGAGAACLRGPGLRRVRGTARLRGTTSLHSTACDYRLLRCAGDSGANVRLRTWLLWLWVALNNLTRL